MPGSRSPSRRLPGRSSSRPPGGFLAAGGLSHAAISTSLVIGQAPRVQALPPERTATPEGTFSFIFAFRRLLVMIAAAGILAGISFGVWYLGNWVGETLAGSAGTSEAGVQAFLGEVGGFFVF